MEGIIRWREGLRRRALEVAREVSGRLRGTVFLVGSYARGDFMEDSDVDLLVVGEFSGPPHRRLLDVDLPGNVEVIALNVGEVREVVRRCYPLALDIALGIVLRDDLGIASELISNARRCVGGNG
ncbi:nucleotidyltransferase domain-containing protein [Vulcanisaeta thermophila]|uniref:nucleotidyltransferase domain-containing protein n=1 Tax=Vulcanisaeta thermophila TaxID=867917 RepID=UPI00085369A4|nr:nucleotidyltransferase domain-containing protein [Vulcanisaeta thermophila]